MDELEQTLREILSPQKVAAYLDVSQAFGAAAFSENNFVQIMLDLGTIIRDDKVPWGLVCESCCFEYLNMHHCFGYCALGEIFHFSGEVFRNLHPQTATSLKNLCQRKNDL